MTFLFFRRKTGYEMRMSDWSSDVCSSDLVSDIEVMGLRAAGRCPLAEGHLGVGLAALHPVVVVADADDLDDPVQLLAAVREHLGRELDGPGREWDVRGVGLAAQPLVIALAPGLKALGVDQLDHTGGNHCRSSTARAHRQLSRNIKTPRDTS